MCTYMCTREYTREYTRLNPMHPCCTKVLALISYFQSTHDVSGTLERMPPSKTREGYILRALRRHGFTEVSENL